MFLIDRGYRLPSRLLSEGPLDDHDPTIEESEEKESIDLLCLLEFYNTYDHDDIYHEVAEKMLQSFEQIQTMNAQELADYLFISPSTLYRFIKMMYYSSHKEMKGRQQLFFEQYTANGRYFPKETDRTQGLNGYADQLSRSARQLAADLDRDTLADLEETLLEAAEIIFVGIPMPSLAWRLQVELTLLGKKTSAFLNPLYQLEAVKAAAGGAVIFMLHYTTGDGDFYHQIADLARDKGCKIAILSNNPIASIVRQADLPLCFEGDLSESDLLLIGLVLDAIGDHLYRKVRERRKPT